METIKLTHTLDLTDLQIKIIEPLARQGLVPVLISKHALSFIGDNAKIVVYHTYMNTFLEISDNVEATIISQDPKVIKELSACLQIMSS